LVARFVRDEEVVGSNPATPTLVISQDIGDRRTYGCGFACCYLRVGPGGRPVSW
jgi:hypothetical protein